MTISLNGELVRFITIGREFHKRFDILKLFAGVDVVVHFEVRISGRVLGDKFINNNLFCRYTAGT